ncbi:Hypothetical predicted protein [Lecanosticta acicola]|uniref:Uncharacterized protein n=1 Tax=Lecanosticta acicola TaxID=111012 RepID=A0AAI9EAZ9_9PEZI|nr:Hypothetical predicted protein [Lecanosticta acicola]
MCRWYYEAKFCHAYLADVEPGVPLKDSKWFTRSWTLQGTYCSGLRGILRQGLGAPSESKQRLADQLAEITPGSTSKFFETARRWKSVQHRSSNGLGDSIGRRLGKKTERIA